MRYACTHTFTVEADSDEQFRERLRAWHRKVNVASKREGIGFTPGLALGHAWPEPAEAEPQPTTEPETLFDAVT